MMAAVATGNRTGRRVASLKGIMLGAAPLGIASSDARERRSSE